jgi:hypothetical protein
VIQKLSKIRQKDNETVIQYVSRCAEILLKLKTKTDVLDANMQLQLNAVETAAHNGIEETLRVTNTREIKQKPTITLNVISRFRLVARFKAEIRAGLIKKEGTAHNNCIN